MQHPDLQHPRPQHPPLQHHCLIVEPMPLVAHDLATTARENLGLSPLIAASAAEAEALLAALGPAGEVRLAFVHQRPSEFAPAPLRAALEARGAQIVLIGAATAGAAAEIGWPALAWPFATEHVLALITRLGGGGEARPCGP